jgi:hypothetical protein
MFAAVLMPATGQPGKLLSESRQLLPADRGLDFVEL